MPQRVLAPQLHSLGPFFASAKLCSSLFRICCLKRWPCGNQRRNKQLHAIKKVNITQNNLIKRIHTHPGFAEHQALCNASGPPHRPLWLHQGRPYSVDKAPARNAYSCAAIRRPLSLLEVEIRSAECDKNETMSFSDWLK